MFKKIAIFLLVGMITAGFVGCATAEIESSADTVNAIESGLVLIGQQNNYETDNGYGYAYLYEDSETGVQYFVYLYSSGAAMCPRYDEDGNIYVNKEGK